MPASAIESHDVAPSERDSSALRPGRITLEDGAANKYLRLQTEVYSYWRPRNPVTCPLRRSWKYQHWTPRGHEKSGICGADQDAGDGR